MGTVFTIARRFLGLVLAFISLLCLSLSAFSIANFRGDATASPSARIVVIIALVIFSSLLVFASWRLFKSRTSVAEIPSYENEQWQSAEGQVFHRSWKSAIPLILISPLISGIWLATLIGLVAIITSIGERSIFYSIKIIIPVVIFFVIVSMPMYVLWKLFRLKGAPLAVVGRDGITLPRSKPGYVSWDNVTDIVPVRVGKGVFLEIRLADPSRIFAKPRRWWHGPWRNNVMVGIGNMRHPLVATARQAKEDAHVRLGRGINHAGTA